MATTKKPTGSKSRTQKNKSSSSGTTKSKSKAAPSKSKKTSSSKTVAAKSKKGSGAKASASSGKSTTSKAKSTKKNSGKTTAASRKKTTAAKSKSKSSKGIIATAIDAVAEIFKPGSPDAIELLKADHRKVEDLFARVKSNEDGNNAATFKKIKRELDVHTHIEETIYYPHLLDHGDKELKKIVREGFEEHGQVKDLLVELSTLSGDSPTFKAKLKVLMENVEHHVEEEEDEMFPMVEDQIPADMLQRLGSLMYGEKVKVLRKSPAPKTKKASAASGR